MLIYWTISAVHYAAQTAWRLASPWLLRVSTHPAVQHLLSVFTTR